MKPKTKEQEKIVKWTNQHDGPTPKQAAYARRHCFSDLILESCSTCVCTACKHTWRIKDTSVYKLKCPHCGKTMNVIHNHRKYTQREYFTVLTTKANMQVIMWYLVARTVSKTRDDVCFAHVGSEWITHNGTRYSVELPRYTMSMYKDQWIYGVPMQLRTKSTFARYCGTSAVYCVRILPILKRNGWKNISQFFDYNTEVMRNLLSNKYFESWFKVGHYGVCQKWLHMENDYLCGYNAKPTVTDDMLTLIRLANRKHIIFDTYEKWADHLDYIKDLVYMNQDIHNPKILFPEDFQAAHQALSERVCKRRHREAEIAQRQRYIELMERKAKKDLQTKTWLCKYAQCFGNMHLASDGFTILPLVSMDDFKCEAAHMHHCIAAYYGKLDTLLLSIEHNGKKCETAEIDLLGAGRIIQCRGVNNQPSDYHNDIVDILKGFMAEFIRRFNKPVAQPTLPVPMSFYQQFQIAI